MIIYVRVNMCILYEYVFNIYINSIYMNNYITLNI